MGPRHGGNLAVAALNVGPGQAILLAQSTTSTERTLARLGSCCSSSPSSASASRLSRAGRRHGPGSTGRAADAAAEDIARTGRPEPIEVDSGTSDDEISRLA